MYSLVQKFEVMERELTIANRILKAYNNHEGLYAVPSEPIDDSGFNQKLRLN
jgi:hypothetical protein